MYSIILNAIVQMLLVAVVGSMESLFNVIVSSDSLDVSSITIILY